MDCTLSLSKPAKRTFFVPALWTLNGAGIVLLVVSLVFLVCWVKIAENKPTEQMIEGGLVSQEGRNGVRSEKEMRDVLFFFPRLSISSML